MAVESNSPNGSRGPASPDRGALEPFRPGCCWASIPIQKAPDYPMDPDPELPVEGVVDPTAKVSDSPDDTGMTENIDPRIAVVAAPGWAVPMMVRAGDPGGRSG